MPVHNPNIKKNCSYDFSFIYPQKINNILYTNTINMLNIYNFFFVARFVNLILNIILSHITTIILVINLVQ